MKLLLRRSQRKSIFGNMIFVLDVRAEMSRDERLDTHKYRLQNYLLYEKLTMLDRGAGLLGLLSRIWFSILNVVIRARHLHRGRRLECRDIVEMLATEEHLQNSTKEFASTLAAAKRYGGEFATEFAT